MMNGIRYRQWDPTGKEWFSWGFDETISDFHQPITLPDGTYPESFQSTGFYDSTRTEEFPKGVEIWRGSLIVPVIGHPVNYVIEQATDGQWILKGKDGWYHQGDSLENFLRDYPHATVIGDTMQTPDLMEVKK